MFNNFLSTILPSMR